MTRYLVCPTCGEDAPPWRDELWDAQSQVWTGFQDCGNCQARMVYHRSATKEEAQMARRGGQKKAGDAHAVNQILEVAARNGEIVEDFLPSETVVPATAIEQAQQELGPPPLPPMEAAPAADVARRQFDELGEIYQAVERAQARFDAKSKAAKAAKAELEDTTATLLSVVRRMTAPPSLPLFDQAQSEADLAAMQTASTAALEQLEAVDQVQAAAEEDVFGAEDDAAAPTDDTVDDTVQL